MLALTMARLGKEQLHMTGSRNIKVAKAKEQPNAGSSFSAQNVLTGTIGSSKDTMKPLQEFTAYCDPALFVVAGKGGRGGAEFMLAKEGQMVVK